MQYKTLVLLWLISSFLFSCHVPRTDLLPDQSSLRNTEQGAIIGADNGKTHQWLGIPYADIPSSEYRWREAKAPLPWEGVRQTLEFGPFCTQLGSLINSTKRKDWGEIVGSENCLNLNIWAPKPNPTEIENQNIVYPVMVWIHGGSNTAGSADLYNPTELVYRHNLVVVTINYRLGPFGWFRHPSLIHQLDNKKDQSGNYGNLDTIAALKWVKNNIANFGGDTNNITIFGESAGGYNVAALLSSTLAEGLFHKAVVQSGGIKPGDITHSENFLSEPVPWKNYSSKELFNELLIAKGMAANKKEATEIQTNMLSKNVGSILRSATTKEIFQAYLEARFNTNNMLRPFPDGTVLHEQGIMQSLKEGLSSEIPIILGTNRDENKLFLVNNPRYVRTIFGLPRSRDRVLYDAIAKHRSNTWKYLAVDNPSRELILSGRSNIFAYRFDWDDEPRRLGVDISHLLGAAHAFEIPFVMGNLDKDTLTRYIVGRKNLDSVKQLSEAMMSYWAEFAYTGDPGMGRKGDLPLWEHWSEPNKDAPKYIVFDSDLDRGIRMSTESISKDSLLADIANDEDIKDPRLKCELVDIAIQYDDLEKPEFLDQFNGGQCQQYNPDDWRQTWYESFNEPW